MFEIFDILCISQNKISKIYWNKYVISYYGYFDIYLVYVKENNMHISLEHFIVISEILGQRHHHAR